MENDQDLSINGKKEPVFGAESAGLCADCARERRESDRMLLALLEALNG